MDSITEDIHMGHSPMRLVGVDIQRSYTVIRHGENVSIVSPTDSMDHEAIGALGSVAHIVAPTCFHDTGMRTAAAAFPEATLWAVAGTEKHLRGLKLRELDSNHTPEEWEGRLRCFGLEGMPRVNEHVIWHIPSRSLITSDLVFNIQPPVDVWTRFFFKMNAAWQQPGPTRIFRACIRDKAAFAASVQPLRELPIKRILPAHGSPIIKPEQISQILVRLGCL